jgi:hypothetical protein
LSKKQAIEDAYKSPATSPAQPPAPARTSSRSAPATTAAAATRRNGNGRATAATSSRKQQQEEEDSEEEDEVVATSRSAPPSRRAAASSLPPPPTNGSRYAPAPSSAAARASRSRQVEQEEAQVPPKMGRLHSLGHWLYRLLANAIIIIAVRDLSGSTVWVYDGTGSSTHDTGRVGEWLDSDIPHHLSHSTIHPPTDPTRNSSGLPSRRA